MEGVVGLGWEGSAEAHFWSGRKVLLTGATGFVGSHLARRMVELGADLFLLARASADFTRIADVRPRVRIVTGDLLDAPSIGAAVRDASPSVVYHLAAFGVDRPLEDAARAAQVNVLGTVRLLDGLRGSAVERFVYLGTCYEHANDDGPVTPEARLRPANVYAATKTGGALVCLAHERLHGLPLVIVRPFQAYGPWQGLTLLIPHVITTLLDGRTVQLTSGRQVRDFLHVSDLVEGLVRAGARPEAVGQTFTMGSGGGHCVREVVEEIHRLLGNRGSVRFGGLPHRAGEVWELCSDNSKAQTLLGWSPKVSLGKGLASTITWYTTNRALMQGLAGSN